MMLEFTSDMSAADGQGFEARYTCGGQRPPTPPSAPPPPPTPIQANGQLMHEEITADMPQLAFALRAEGGKTYQIEVSLDTLEDSVCEIFSPAGVENGEILAENDDYGEAEGSDAGYSRASYIEWTCPETATYYIVVHGFGDQYFGTFEVGVTMDEGIDGGGGGPCDPGGTQLAGEEEDISYMPRGQYEDNEECEWHIQCQQPGTVPSFTFSSFNTEGGFDIVNVYSGATADASDSLSGDLSGRMDDLPSISFESTESAMVISFTSDGSMGGDGFEGAFTCGQPNSGGNSGGACEDVLGARTPAPRPPAITSRKYRTPILMVWWLQSSSTDPVLARMRWLLEIPAASVSARPAP
jgi:hypothetical protein